MTTDTPDTVLTAEQLARAEALVKARRVLTTKGFASEGGADPLDLIEVATWIIDGQDPLTDYRQQPAGPTFVSTIRDAAEATAREYAGWIGVDPDAPLPDPVLPDDPADDDTQLGSVTA